LIFATLIDQKPDSKNHVVAAAATIGERVNTTSAGAQFLNVIESVFSGMARAIIHNSNYGSIDAAKGGDRPVF
jgi:hypothetical protein